MVSYHLALSLVLIFIRGDFVNVENKNKFLAHARMISPREACGLLIVEGGKETLVICRNVSEYKQQSDYFVIDPHDYAEAEERGQVIAVIHSHPMSSPQPSEADRVSCEQTKIPWFIVGGITGEWFKLEPSGYKAPLVGRTWAHGVLDCYSLIRDYYMETLGIEIPDYDRDFEWWIKGEDLYSKHFGDAGFIEVPFDQLKKHDVLLMQVKSGVINHGGVYLGDDIFLHHCHQRLSSRDVFGGYWFKHTVKVIRHRSQFNENN